MPSSNVTINDMQEVPTWYLADSGPGPWPCAPKVASQAEDRLPGWPCSACWEPARLLRSRVASAGLRGPSGHGHALLPSGRAGAPLRPPRSSLRRRCFRRFCPPRRRGPPRGQGSLRGLAYCPPASGVTCRITGPVAGPEPLRPSSSRATLSGSPDCPRATPRLRAWSPYRRGGGCSLWARSRRWRAGGGAAPRPWPGPGEDRGPVALSSGAVRGHPEHSGWKRRRDAEQAWRPHPGVRPPPPPPAKHTVYQAAEPRTSPLVSGSPRSGFLAERTALRPHPAGSRSLQTRLPLRGGCRPAPLGRGFSSLFPALFLWWPFTAPPGDRPPLHSLCCVGVLAALRPGSRTLESVGPSAGAPAWESCPLQRPQPGRCGLEHPLPTQLRSVPAAPQAHFPLR